MGIRKFLSGKAGGPTLTGAVVLAGFTIILAGVSLAGIQTAGILRLDSRIADARQAASRLNGLSKDLLITDNLFQTWNDWTLARTELSRSLDDILSDPVAVRTLSGPDGQRQIQYTRKLQELVDPRLDRIGFMVENVLDRFSVFSGGLMTFQQTGVPVIDDSRIGEVREFSLYIGDLWNVRLGNLADTVGRSAQATIRNTALILIITSIVILALILWSLRALARALAENDRNAHYIEGVLNAVFEISGQGFLTFGADLKVDPSNASQITRILGENPGQKDAAELLWENTGDQKDFRDGMALVFAGKTRPEVVFDLFEKEVRKDANWLRINFRALPNERIMMALTDVSREHALMELQQDEENRKSLILKAVGRKRFFALFVSDARKLFERAGKASPLQTDLDSLMREIHTFKGNAAFFGFRRTATAAHELEFHVEEAKVFGTGVDMSGRMGLLMDRYMEELGYITEFLGDEWLHTLDSVAVPLPAWLRLERYVRSRYGQDRQLLAHLMQHRRLPLRDLFAKYPPMAEGLAEQMGKLLKPVIIQGGEFPVLPDRFGPLVQVLVHLVRNMVDHGIEPPREREEAGKLPEGTLQIVLQKGPASWMVTLRDDGRGIRREVVEARAREKGLWKEGLSDSGVWELLFLPGFSTSEEITEVSGRGVGMGAVKEVVEAMGGSLSLQSVPGKGTEFDIVIPFTKEIKE